MSEYHKRMYCFYRQHLSSALIGNCLSTTKGIYCFCRHHLSNELIGKGLNTTKAIIAFTARIYLVC